jgi:hypothetical protein
MRLGVPFSLILLVFTVWEFGFAQKQFRQYPAAEYDDFAVPDDYRIPAEFVRGRLRYPSLTRGRGRGFGYGDLNWTIDYPRSDRHMLQILRRLTRIESRSVEQVVDFDEDIYNWPFIYAVEPGHWMLRDEQAAKLRDYLLRGGFLMFDDFHGTWEWDVFMESMSKVFPDRPVVEIDSKDAIFHSVFDLDDRFQVPGAQYIFSGRPYEQDGFEARWRGIYDDKGRVMVAICHNMDLGDAMEWSDDPRYPEKWASLAYRIAINYALYAMTH